MIMTLGTFLTTNGLILAVLLVWTQLWLNTYQIYESKKAPIWTVRLGLMGLYFAIMSALVALSIAAFGALARAPELFRYAVPSLVSR